MKPHRKAVIIVDVIGLFCIYVVFGTIYYFVSGYDLLSTLRLLAIQTIALVVLAIVVVAVVWVLFFVIGKIKR